MAIEKVIHQIWDGDNVPFQLRILSCTWKRFNPNWEYHLWNKKEMVELVDSYFPEWANLYHSLPFNIQRLDMIRYMILYCHGGVYVDLDIECFKSIDPLVENKSFFLGMEPPEHWVCFNGSKQRVVGNAFMGSSNNHKGWLRILSDIDFTVKNRIYRDDIVLNTTGPEKTTRLIAQMHKAITIIQFKLEGEIIRRRPEFEMDDRMLLHHIDLKRGVVHIDGKDYTLKDTNWPTLDPKDPYRLSIEEEDLIRKILHSFESSEKMKKHMRCFFRHGGMYQVCNSNLLFHASIPMNPDGTFKSVRILGQDYKGRALLDRVDQLIRTAYFKTGEQEEVEYAHDYIWYLWGGKDSPLFDKSKMATFERAFIEEAETHKEEKGAYYTLREQEEICDRILDEFGVTGMHRHIINGHVPVRSNQGENPIKANGKMLVIDGGFSRPYHLETGIAGYTLVYHSRGFQLVQHEPFESRAKAIEEGLDIKSTTIVVELSSHRQMVKDTDKGADLQSQIKDLEKLLYAYRNGLIKEKERMER